MDIQRIAKEQKEIELNLLLLEAKYANIKTKLFSNRKFIKILKNFKLEESINLSTENKILSLLSVDLIISNIIKEKNFSYEIKDSLIDQKSIIISKDKIYISKRCLNEKISLLTFLKDYFYSYKLQDLQKIIKTDDLKEYKGNYRFYKGVELLEAKKYSEEMILKSVEKMIKHHYIDKKIKNYNLTIKNDNLFIEHYVKRR